VKCCSGSWQLAVGIAVTVTMTERQVTATSDNMWERFPVSSFHFHTTFHTQVYTPDIHFKISLFLFLVFDFDSTLTSTRYFVLLLLVLLNTTFLARRSLLDFDVYYYYLSCPSLPSYFFFSTHATDCFSILDSHRFPPFVPLWLFS
jgi:hypothetical protein